MGTFDGTEVCELVRLYLLNKIKLLLGSSNVGLYRDNGQAIVHKANGPKVDRLRKDLIIIDTNLLETNFLDVPFNLNTGKYFLFKKPNSTSLYIYIQNPTTHRQLSINCHQ